MWDENHVLMTMFAVAEVWFLMPNRQAGVRARNCSRHVMIVDRGNVFSSSSLNGRFTKLIPEIVLWIIGLAFFDSLYLFITAYEVWTPQGPGRSGLPVSHCDGEPPVEHHQEYILGPKIFTSEVWQFSVGLSRRRGRGRAAGAL